jgi:tellurite resistance-related uncharacterized protein
VFVRSSPTWDERTMPAGLLTAHQVAPGTWGRINVYEGELRFVAETEPAIDVALGPDSIQAIPPEVRHAIQPVGSVRFSIDFYTIRHDWGTASTGTTPGAPEWDALPDGADREGGESACLAHLLCAECGAVLDASGHVAGCLSDEVR